MEYAAHTDVRKDTHVKYPIGFRCFSVFVLLNG